MTQLVYEYDILSAWLEGSGSNKYFKTGRNGKVKKRKAKNNPDTLKYLLFAWGASFDTISRFRKKFQESAVARGVAGDAAKCTNTMVPNESNVNAKNIIDSFDSAKVLFTPEYLFIREKVMNFKNQLGTDKMNLNEKKKYAQC